MFLLRTSVCVYRPASTDALTYISLLEGVFIVPERIVSQPFVLAVCLHRTSSDVANPNFDDGVPPVGVASLTASLEAPLFTLAAPSAFGSGLVTFADFPQEPSTSAIDSAPRMRPKEVGLEMRWRAGVRSSNPLMVLHFAYLARGWNTFVVLV